MWRRRLDTRMVGEPREMYAQRDGGKVRETRWAHQVVLYALAMPETRGTRPDAVGRLDGRFDGTAVHFGRWDDGDGVARYREVVSYVLPERQLPAARQTKALPAPREVML